MIKLFKKLTSNRTDKVREEINVDDISSIDDINSFLKKYNLLFDVIIDDASHASHHQQIMLSKMFYQLKSGGYYFIEDTQTSYWPRYGGSSFDFDNKKSAINFFKKIIDKINYKEFDNPFFLPDFFAKNITQIHFYHNMIVIKKNINNEKSNVIVNRMLPFKNKSFFKFKITVRYLKYLFYFLMNFYNKFLNFLKM
jgi:hypothetical protein